eukprot:2917179-Rhodomonas_salina.1
MGMVKEELMIRMDENGLNAHERRAQPEPGQSLPVRAHYVEACCPLPLHDGGDGVLICPPFHAGIAPDSTARHRLMWGRGGTRRGRWGRHGAGCFSWRAHLHGGGHASQFPTPPLACVRDHVNTDAGVCCGLRA